MDDDGCPEPGAHDMTVVSGANVSVIAPVRFLPGQAKVTPQLAAQLRMIAQRTLGMQPLQSVIVETYADTSVSNPRNDKLASDRADAIRTELLAAGIPANVLTVAEGDVIDHALRAWLEEGPPRGPITAEPRWGEESIVVNRCPFAQLRRPPTTPREPSRTARMTPMVPCARRACARWMHAGSLEALRVTRPKAVGLAAD